MGRLPSIEVSSLRSVGTAVASVRSLGSEISVLDGMPTVSAAGLAWADPETEEPQAATARMVAAARLKAAMMVERVLMCTPAGPQPDGAD